MKSKNIFLTNLILIVLVASVLMSFSACSFGSDESSAVQSDSLDNKALTVNAAKDLIEKDKKVIEIFACNSLCSDDAKVEFLPLDDNHEFRDFNKIRELLSSVYSSDGGQIESFLKYPVESAPSVSGVDGITNVFRHPGLGFDDFIVPDSVSVTASDNGATTVIKAKTESGREVELEAVFENEKWLLKNSLLFVLPADNSYDKKLPLSDLGSLSAFSGEVLVINFFISDVNYKFTDEDEVAFAARVSTAVDYLVSETERLGGEVNVTYDNAYFEHIGNIGNGDLPFDIVFSETGFGTLQNFAEEKYDLSKYDNYFFAVCFNKECENLYKAYEGGDTTEVYFAERLFVGTNTTEADIARMALKLLGAYDYRSGVCDEYTESLYQAYFKNDILSGGSLDESTVSPVTAYCCGMINELPELYHGFIYTQEDNQEQSEEE